MKMKEYQDISKSPRERAEALLSEMTLPEKIAQMQCRMVFSPEMVTDVLEEGCGVGEIMVGSAAQSPEDTARINCQIIQSVIENDRLGIPPILHSEALSGAVLPQAVVFPSAIGLGATSEPQIVEDMADTISGQLRSTGYRQALSPVMDLGRDPRWGRIGETYSEDPALCAMMSVAYTKGLQGPDGEKGVSATGKHFLGYSYGEGGLNMSGNPITRREIREDYARPFQAAITEGGLKSIMNSYGSIDNEMVIGSHEILTNLLREEMGFGGIVVSDYESIEKLVSHRISENMEDAGITALKAGLDIECPMPKGYNTSAIMDAIRDGRLDEALVDQAVSRILETKFALGLFENPYALSDEDVKAAFYAPVHWNRSLEAARKSIVLVKNQGILPLKDQKIALIGSHADSLRQLFGCYTMPAAIDMGMSRALADQAGMEEAQQGDGSEFVQEDLYPGSEVRREREDVRQALQYMYGANTPTIRSALCNLGAKVEYAKGCDYAGQDRSGFAEALEIAKNADVIIMAAGGKYGWGDSCTVGEGLDSMDIGLPGVQEELALELCATGKPVILLHMDARPLSSPRLTESCAAILECWYPGSTGGQAIAEILLGKENPSGRLPVTALRHAGQIPCYAGQKTGNGYRAIREKMSLCRYVENSAEPLYVFGHGLSYTSYQYSNLCVTSEVSADGEVKIAFTVKNTGTAAGEEVAQLYVQDVAASMLRPGMEFAGCCRVALEVGEEKRVTMVMKASQFAFLNQSMQWVVEAGEMKLFVGASSDDIRLQGSFRILNTKIIDARKRGFYARQE